MPVASFAQDRLSKMPNYERYQSQPGVLRQGFKSGAINVRWADDSKSFAYSFNGKSMKFDIATMKATEVVGGPAVHEFKSTDGDIAGPRAQNRGPAPRGRQFPMEYSADGKWRSTYKDRNLWLGPPNGEPTMQITNDGNDANRVKSGTATWVYGEELNQRTAMWWSPDSKKIAYYRFDETGIPDYFLTQPAGGFENRLYIEPYAKTGAKNPLVDVCVYDLESKKAIKVDVREGREFDEGVGHYVYGVSWSPDGTELLFHRTNRLQNEMQWCAANPETGKVRVIITEKWPTWTQNTPNRFWFADKKRLLWATDRNGFTNYILIDLAGKLHNAVTQVNADVAQVVKFDETGKKLYYMAGTGETPHRIQFRVVGLDGKRDRQLTDSKFTHRVQLSPNGEYFVDIAQTAMDAPTTTLVRVKDAKQMAELGKSDLSGFLEKGGQLVERFEFTAADGKTKLWGRLAKPSNFDPSKKYPAILGVYNGPESGAFNESFGLPDSVTELGFLSVSMESRGGNGRGKAFQDEMYLKCGTTEIDDIAAGVKHLASKYPFFDGSRVGIEGTSYGGYTSIMCLVRYPELFHAASASSAVTDWRHYDTIYTERYMSTPQLNPKGYEAGSAMTYARNMKGWLLMFFGTMDDNVHPANTYHLITALSRAGKSYDLQVGPDQGHAGVNNARQLEFFIERLILSPGK